MLTVAKNENYGFVFSGSSGGASSAGETRQLFDIYDFELAKKLTNKGVSQEDLANQIKIGKLELSIKDGSDFDVTSLIRIDIVKSHRGKRHAPRVIQDIVETTGGALVIRDIQKSAYRFWKKFNLPFLNDSGKEQSLNLARSTGAINMEIPTGYDFSLACELKVDCVEGGLVESIKAASAENSQKGSVNLSTVNRLKCSA